LLVGFTVLVMVGTRLTGFGFVKTVGALVVISVVGAIVGFTVGFANPLASSMIPLKFIELNPAALNASTNCCNIVKLYVPLANS